jgi:hypothetical protein
MNWIGFFSMSQTTTGIAGIERMTLIWTGREKIN